MDYGCGRTEVTFESVPNGHRPAGSCVQFTAQMDRCTDEAESGGSVQLQAKSHGQSS